MSLWVDDAKLTGAGFTSSPGPTDDDVRVTNGVNHQAGGGSGVTPEQDALIATITAKAPLASPTFTGTPAAPTATGGASTTQIATTAFVQGEITAKAPLANPTFTGTPEAPTATPGANTTQIATTAFVTGAVTGLATLAGPTFTGVPAAPTASLGTNTTQVATTAFVAAALTDIADNLVTTIVDGTTSAVTGFTVNGATFDTAIGSGTWLTVYRETLVFTGEWFKSSGDATALGNIAFIVNPEGGDLAAKDATAIAAFIAGTTPLIVSDIDGNNDGGDRISVRSSSASNVTSVYVGIAGNGSYAVVTTGTIEVGELLRITVPDADAAKTVMVTMRSGRNLANTADGVAARFVTVDMMRGF